MTANLESQPGSLQARDLCLMRGEWTLIDHLSLGITAGEVLHIRGPNGCGKTTLLRSLSGLTRAEAGEVDWRPPQDADATGATEPDERLLFIGHRPAINTALSPTENLAYHRAMGIPGSTSIDAALAAFGLADLEARRCATLSAGQLRRTALARLLTERAALWILDEPFAALDQAGTALLGELIDSHADTGGLAVITSHQRLPLETRGLRTLDLSKARGG